MMLSGSWQCIFKKKKKHIGKCENTLKLQLLKTTTGTDFVDLYSHRTNEMVRLKDQETSCISVPANNLTAKSNLVTAENGGSKTAALPGVSPTTTSSSRWGTPLDHLRLNSIFTTQQKYEK